MDRYKLSQAEKVKVNEKKLKKEIADLKNEVEECEMLFGRNFRPVSSVNPPMSAEYYHKLRSLAIKNALTVSEAQPLKSQGQVMTSELEATLKSDITHESLPLLLHQFYVDRMQSLVQCKHMHMLRWRRFCEHTEAIERLFPKYVQRLSHIKEEYEDARHRAQRLSAAYHSYVLQDGKISRCLQAEDVAIFFRWLVSHVHFTKTFTAYMRLVQWLPSIHKTELSKSCSQRAKRQADVETSIHSSASSKPHWKTMASGLEYLAPSNTASSSSTRGLSGRRSSMTAASNQAFVGFVSNETTLGIPCHAVELPRFRDQLESLAAEYGIVIHTELLTSADEMELFGAVNRQFKVLLSRQTECSTFYQYDNPPPDYDYWGIDSASHCLEKPSNWLKYIRIKPRNEANQLRQISFLKQKGNIDELLRSQNEFLKVQDFALVTEALKEHAVAVREPPTVQAITVTTHQRGTMGTISVWQRIYENAEKSANSNEGENGETHSETNASRIGTYSRKKESYDYANTMQMLGLDEGDESTNHDPTVFQGAYLSFLHLRHLKIRDLKRQCLAIFNYFRSVERTLTIFDGGYSLAAQQKLQDSRSDSSLKGKKKRSKSSTHMSQPSVFSRLNQAQGGRGQTLGIGSHHYAHSTPADYKVDQNEFMEYGGVENHDDFYTLDFQEEPEADTSGRGDAAGEWKSFITAASVSSSTLGANCTPHVQDPRGYFIMYDAAIEDLHDLDEELLLVASQFIEKDVANRAVVHRSSMERAQRRYEAPGEVDIPSYGHREVDRFAVLVDMWTCEVNFLVNKRKLMDCYLEAYHNTFDSNERQSLCQVITDIMHQRPRYDFTQDYFVRTYQAECTTLRLKTCLLTKILTNHIDECKEYLNKINRPKHEFGMPLHTQPRQEISINLPRPALKHMDMLEFHPTLGAIACRFAESMEVVFHELTTIYHQGSMSEMVGLEKQMMELAQEEWDCMPVVGSSYTNAIQRNVFNDIFIGNASLMNVAVTQLISDNERNDVLLSEERSAMQKEVISTWIRAVDVVLLRNRLIDLAWETEIVARLYKQACTEMGFEEHHLYLRLVQFEFAHRKDKVDPSPTSMMSLVPDDLNADRFMPAHLVLSVHEIDESHLPKFSFNSQEAVLELIKADGTLENLRIAVACQVMNKNALVVAITQSENCSRWKDTDVGNPMAPLREASDSKSNVSVSTTMTQGTARSGATNATSSGKRQHPTFTGNRMFSFDKVKKPQEPFISIQLEKVGPRDVVVNEYIHKKETKGMLLKKEGEIEKLKRTLATNYCREVTFRMSLHAMRSQIIAYYSSMLSALEAYPACRENYFMLGKPNEKKRKVDDIAGVVPDPRSFQKRPRRVISSDGQCLLNLWFIPHYTEVISSYRNLGYETQEVILINWLTIVSSLHDILLYLCAHARLGSATSVHELGLIGYYIAADWGGSEGIGVHLSEIQEQLNAMEGGPAPHTQSPHNVAKMLTLRKEVLYLEFDTAVRHALTDNLLAMGNTAAFRSVNENMQVGLPRLSNIWETSLFAIHLQLPQPLDATSTEAKHLFPWLCFQALNGRYSVSYSRYWRDVESSMQLCLAGLDDTERQLANGELLGVSLLLQEVLNNGTRAYHALEGPSNETKKGLFSVSHLGKNAATASSCATPDSAKPKQDKFKEAAHEVIDLARRELGKKNTASLDPDAPLDKKAHSIEAYWLMKTFLRLWKQLEIFKMNWVKSKLHALAIDTPALHEDMTHIFRSEIMLPVYTSMARQMGNFDLFDEIPSEDQPLPPPPGATEFEVRAKLLIKLLEVYECKMISETRQVITKAYTLALAERSREESALPSDLWKQQTNETSEGGRGTRENFTVTRPRIAEDFVQRLLSQGTTENGSITFSKKHLNECVTKLASDIMYRERENYESYSSYYENMLRHHEHLLYKKELEMKAIRLKQGARGDGAVEAQFQLADRSHELILEVTALRAKISEMREQSMTMDQDIRDEVRREYQDLVQNLFEACFKMRSKLAQCHLSIHDDVRNLITEARDEAMKSLGKLKNQTPTSTAEERLRTIAVKEEQVRGLQHERYELKVLLSKMHALNHLKRFAAGGRFKTTVEQLTQEAVKAKRDCLGKQLVSKEEVELLQEELKSARRSLQGSEEKLKKTHEQIEREKKLRKEKEYRDLQEQRNRQQLVAAKQRDMDRLMIELQEKDKRLKNLTVNVERSNKIEHNNHTKIQRSLKQMHDQLSLERSLKLDAFDRVDNLQAQVLDVDRENTIASPSRPTSGSISICKSAITQRSKSQSAILLTSPTSNKPIKVRPMSSAAAYYRKQSDPQLPRQRPMTAAARMKNRIAAAILSEISPSTDEHETIIRLGRVTD